MVIGVPKEIKPEEHRVALTPRGAAALVARGHAVLCEFGLGVGSGFADMEYIEAGASLCKRERVFSEAELIVKVKEPIETEYPLLRSGQAIFTYLHLAPNRRLTDLLMERGLAAFAYETLEKDGALPLLAPMSEIAGSMAPIMGSFMLQRHMGGRGVLPAGATGVPPAGVLILGAGVVGRSALRVARALGCDVTVLNRGRRRIDEIEAEYGAGVKTGALDDQTIAAAIKEADMVIGAVYARGGRTPLLVRRQMLSTMRPGAVVVDVSIDQGGCFETSTPTTHADPAYIVDGIVHYAVANMPGAYPRTSTMALSEATLPFIEMLAAMGVEGAAGEGSPLRSALNVYKGKTVHPGLKGC